MAVGNIPLRIAPATMASYTKPVGAGRCTASPFVSALPAEVWRLLSLLRAFLDRLPHFVECFWLGTSVVQFDMRPPQACRFRQDHPDDCVLLW